MAWLDQREHIKNIPLDIMYKILRAGLSSEHVADILSCSTIDDLLALNWLPDTAFGKLVGDTPRIESATAYKTWDSTGSISTQPYNINTNYSRHSTGYRVASTGENIDAVIIGNHSGDLSLYERWGWHLNDNNNSGGTISLAEDIGNNHTFVFFNGVSRNMYVKGVRKSDGAIVDISGNWTFTADDNAPSICIDSFFDGKHHYATFGVGLNTLLGSVYIDRYNNGIHDGWIRNSMTGKVFLNDSDLAYYLRTGDDSRALNGDGKTPSGKAKNYYIKCKTMSYTDLTKGNPVNLANNTASYDFNSNVDGFGGTRPIAGYVIDEPTGKYNISMLMNDDAEFMMGTETFENTTREEITSFDDMTNDAWTWTTVYKYGSLYYGGTVITNIPIFRTRGLAEQYLKGRIGLSWALNQGGTFNGLDSDIGKQKDKSEIKQYTIFNSFCKLYACDSDDMDSIIDVLYNDDIETLNDIIDGLKLNGENPISFVVDCYHVPFNILPFTSQTTSVHTMRFGTYVASLTGSPTLIGALKPQTMFNVDITPTYNDFRDFTMKYYLYLPYCGLTQLSAEQWLNTNMECTVIFDAYSGGIKYYLKCNGVVVDTFDGNVRVTQPLYGTDSYASAMAKIGAVSSIMGGFGNASIGAYTKGVSLDSGNIGGNALNFGSMLNDATALTRPPSKQQFGNVSPSSAMFDEMEAYLILEQPYIEYGDGIVSQYGYMDNRFGRIGSNTGFVGVTDVIINGNATESEKANIKALLQKGIYV